MFEGPQNFFNSIFKGWTSGDVPGEIYDKTIVKLPENAAFTGKVAEKWSEDPDNVGMALDPLIGVGAVYRCGQWANDHLEGHTDQEAFHGGMCGLNYTMTGASLLAANPAVGGAGAVAGREALLLAEEEGIQLTELGARAGAGGIEEAAVEEEVHALPVEELDALPSKGTNIPKIMGGKPMVVMAVGTPALSLTDCKKYALTPHCKTVAKQHKEEAKQHKEEAKQRALEKIKAEQLRLQADIWEQAFEDQGVWDTDFRPQLVPAIAQSPQQEDEPMLAHDVVPPTLEPDLQPMQSVSAPVSAPEPANLQTTGAALVLTGVVLYAAYSTYASA